MSEPNKGRKDWDSSSDRSSSPPVKAQGEVQSPDEATPPVPVASSSPLPRPSSPVPLPLPTEDPPQLPVPVPAVPVPPENEAELEDEETEEIVGQDSQAQVSPVGGESQSQAVTPTAPSKDQGRTLEAFSPNKERARRNLNKLKPTKKRVSSTKKAGLVLSVARINKRLKAGRYARRIGLTAAVYMASVLEYLVAEVLELAGNCARYFRKQRVFPRCIQLTLLHDKELFQLTRGAIVPQGGVKPFIHPVLMTGKSEEQEKVPTAHNKEDWYGDGGP